MNPVYRFERIFKFDPVAAGLSIQMFQDWNEMNDTYSQPWYGQIYDGERVIVVDQCGNIINDRNVVGVNK